MFLKEHQHFDKIFRAKLFLIFYLLAVLIDAPGLAVDYLATVVFVVKNYASLINSPQKAFKLGFRITKLNMIKNNSLKLYALSESFEPNMNLNFPP